MKNTDFTEEKWERLGLIFRPDTSLEWSKSHAMIPTPFKLDGKQLITIQVETHLINQVLVAFRSN